MANLKGGTYEKQAKDIFHRLSAFSTGRRGKDDHLTHSNELAIKREMYVRDYIAYMKQVGIEGQKINQTMNNENISTFLNQRLEGLKHSTQENYTRGFSSMLKGLQESNITIPCERSVFDRKVAEIKVNALPDTRTGLSISNPGQKIEQLQSIRFESSILAEVQQNLGLRISEAFEVVKNLNAHYNEANGTIENLVGKGNHTYEPKMISTELVEKIRASECVPSPNTYRNDLKEVGINNPHLWKITYSKTIFNQKIEEGVEYHQALREVSKELNHSCENMSLFYLSKS